MRAGEGKARPVPGEQAERPDNAEPGKQAADDKSGLPPAKEAATDEEA